MTRARRALGIQGEAATVQHLARLGYRVLDRNYRCPLGEIDLVCEHRGTIVFLEVKTRTGAGYGDPLEAVDPRKQRRLARLARYYLAARRLQDRAVRFDAVSVVVGPRGTVAAIEVIPDAFQPEA